MMSDEAITGTPKRYPKLRVGKEVVHVSAFCNRHCMGNSRRIDKFLPKVTAGFSCQVSGWAGRRTAILGYWTWMHGF